MNTTQPFTLKQLDSKFPPMTWRVTSQTRKNVAHTVDLVAGTCTCEEFVFRLNGKDSKIPQGERICKHMDFVRNIAINMVIDKFRENIS